MFKVSKVKTQPTCLAHRPQRVLVKSEPLLQRVRTHRLVELIAAREVQHGAMELRVRDQPDVQPPRRELLRETAYPLT